MCLKWVTVNLELLPSSHFFQQIDSDKTLQVLQPWHERSRWRRRFAWNLEPVVPAGRVGFCRLFADPNRGVAKTAWCQLAELEEGNFRRVPCFSLVFVSLIGCCPSSDLYRSVKLSYELELTWNDLDTCICRSPNGALDRLFQTNHCRCFKNHRNGADGAADLLQALSQSPLLEELAFDEELQIPAAVWQQVPDGAWPKLRPSVSLRIAREELQRLQRQAEGAKCPTPSTSTPAIAADDSVALAGPRRLKICCRSRLGFRCDGANGRFELFAHWSLGS